MVRFIIFSIAMAFSSFSFAATNIWSPQILINGGQNSTNIIGPLAIDSNSKALVGWLPGSNPGTTDSIYSSTLTAGDTIWTPTETITVVPAPTFPAYPVMNITADNYQSAFWGNISLSPLEFTINSVGRSANSAVWSDPVSLTIPGAVPAGGSAKIDQKRNLLAVLPLSSSFTPPFSIQVFTLPAPGTAWSTPIEIGQDGHLSGPVVGVGLNNERGVIVWKTDVPTYSLQTLRYSFLTSSFSPVDPIPTPSGSVDTLNMLLNMSDSYQTTALFTSTDGSLQTVYFAQLSSSGTSWSGPTILSNPANNAQAFSITSDGAGLYSVLWAEIDSLSNGYFFTANITESGTVQNVYMIAGPVAGVTSVDPGSTIAVDYYGNQVAIWSFVSGGGSFVQIASKSIDQVWSTPINLSITGMTPSVVLSNQGTAVAVWIDSGSGNFFSSVNSNIFDIASPAFFIGKLTKNRFLNSTQYLLNMTWSPLPESSISSYRIKQNGHLIAEIPGSGPFEYSLYLPGKKVKQYTIQAIASNGNKSAPLPLKVVK
jgi:hypothetical protein